ncbi:SpaH/EbpB family LPXTG-anchored major pilin [Bifidobacterium adolescentis]|uniref:SpaH/EbpB family LPXTG-anchored major pilin n=1 Tax=Bifidobacterium adolescentis TaxID=1680 RepID=UPI003BB7B1F7
MNKVLKGLVAVVSTAAMAIAGFAGASTAMAAQAAGDTTKLTINGASAGETFNIYRLLNATGNADAVAYYLRTDTRDAAPADSGVAATAKTITDGLKKDANVAAAATIETATQTVTDFLGAKKSSNSSTGDITNFGDMDQWAKSFYAAYLKGKTPAVAADYTATVADGDTSATVDGIQAGYYMIIQTNAASGNAYSVAVVSTAYAGEDGLTVSLKRDTPKLTKKVQDTNDSEGISTGWQDSADYDVNDYVPFQLTGTLPDNIAAYGTYAYIFHDTMSTGLNFVNNDSEHPVKVYAVNGVDRTEIKSGYDVLTEGIKQGETFNVKFADLKKAKAANDAEITINENTKIVVEYYGQLNEKSVIGKDGNLNQAYLEYENNPEAEGESTGKTPEDKVIVFTYEVDINKVNKDNRPLEGATFRLEKKVNDSWTPVAEFAATENGTKYTSKFQRVDDGTYRLTETKAPAGYTPIAPKEFTIFATHDSEAADPKLTEFEIGGLTDSTISSAEGIASADIVNTKGSELPSTGGMGTTVLYAAGAAIVLVAAFGIAFAVRRRNAR